MSMRGKLSPDAVQAINVVRALVLSRKDASNTNNLLREYRELEGHALPFKKFGSPTFEDFLRCCGEFVVHGYEGEFKVYVIPKHDSAHISKMVARQKTIKKRGGGSGSGFSVAAPPRRTNSSGKNWNHSAYTQMYSKMPAQNTVSPRKYHQYQYNNNPNRMNNTNHYGNLLNQLQTVQRQQNNGPNIYRMQPTMNTKIQPLLDIKTFPPSPPNNKIQADNNNCHTTKNLMGPVKQDSNLPADDLRHKLMAKTPAVPVVQKKQISSNDLRNKLIAKPTDSREEEVISRSLKKEQVGRTTLIQRAINEAVQTKDTQILQRQVSSSSNSSAGSVSAFGKRSLQQRLNVNQHTDGDSKPTSPSSINAEFDSKSSSPDESFSSQSSAKISPSRSPTPFVWDLQNANPVELLMLYCAHQKYTKPDYKYFKLKNKRVQCRVTVHESTYSTYPEDYLNEFEAQLAASKTAMESIKRDEIRDTYPMCIESDFEIAVKIFELLKNCTHGMFSKNIPDAFQKAHKLTLPNHWFTIIISSVRLFSIEETTQDNTIVYANFEDSASNNDSLSYEEDIMSLNKLSLPWEERTWNLYITNPVSTVEIWARLIGPEFSGKMETLITDIELSMMEEKQSPTKIELSEYYLVCITDCWHRVRVEAINAEKNQCLCFFIDFGEEEWLPIDDVYVCDSKYLQLPGQSICFSLDGLEDFNENPNAKSHLESLINFKICVGEVLTTKDDYDLDNLYESRIRIILYDTSSEFDINLNAIILKHICDDTPAPCLDRGSINHVTITHVDGNGDIYCQLKGSGLAYIQKLINNLLQSNALDDKKHKGLYAKRGIDQLYLVNDAKDKKWYRASIESSVGAHNYNMFFVDFGIRSVVNVANMYQSDSLSVALSRYPAQAIKTRLFDLPKINEYILGRLRALLKPSTSAMIKVIAHTAIPEVNICMRFEQNDILFCVNQTIRLETELETNSEVISDPRISKTASHYNSFSSSGSSNKLNNSNTSDYTVLSNNSAKDDLSNKFLHLNIHQNNESANQHKTSKYPLPQINELFDVQITIASNPNYFFVQPYSSALQLNRMMTELQKHCAKKCDSRVSVQEGGIYAGLNPDDNHWYRVSVDKNLGGHSYLVYFCDYGQIRVLESGAIRMLPVHLKALPKQAIKAKIHGVQPTHGDWTADDAVRFQQLTADKKFASYIKNISHDKINKNDEFVELSLIDVSTEDDIWIHQILIDEGRAIESA